MTNLALGVPPVICHQSLQPGGSQSISCDGTSRGMATFVLICAVLGIIGLIANWSKR